MRFSSSQPSLVSLSSLLAVFLVLAVGCAALGVTERQASVVIEGIVVQGDTYRVEPLPEMPADWAGPGLPAKVTISNGYGETVEADCDETGLFRTAPIILSGGTEDRLVVSCPGTRGLCLSALDAPLPIPVAGEPHVVRWQITLPPLVRTSADRDNRGRS